MIKKIGTRISNLKVLGSDNDLDDLQKRILIVCSARMVKILIKGKNLLIK